MLACRWGNVSYKLLAIAWFFLLLIKSSYVLRVVKLLNKWWPTAASTSVRTMSYASFASKQGPVWFYSKSVLTFGYCCCPRLRLSMCSYATVCQPWACSCDNLWPVQARITKYGKQFGQDPYSFRGLTFTFKVKFNLNVKISGFTTRVNTQPIQHHCSHKRCDTFRDPYSKKKIIQCHVGESQA